MTNILATLFFVAITNCSHQGIRSYETNEGVLPVPINWQICNISTNVYASLDVDEDRFIVFLKEIPSTNVYELELRSDPNSGTGWRYAITNVIAAADTNVVVEVPIDPPPPPIDPPAGDGSDPSDLNPRPLPPLPAAFPLSPSLIPK